MTPTDVCLGYLASFAEGDPDAVVRWVTDDFANRHTAALGSGCTGQAEYARRVPGFLASMPGLRYEVADPATDVIADGQRVAVAYTLHAIVNGRHIAVPGMMRFEVRGQQVAGRTDYWDSLVFQRQAGLA